MTGRYRAGLKARPAASVSSWPMTLQSCESCGREFRCGADTGACWCETVALGPERVAILREHFERCLCPDCLRVAATPATRPA
jgi:Cysteine-rich CWC